MISPARIYLIRLPGCPTGPAFWELIEQVRARWPEAALFHWDTVPKKKEGITALVVVMPSLDVATWYWIDQS